ncbi:MAG: YtxH domain-containing protein [Acidimicrobiia bacterium]
MRFRFGMILGFSLGYVLGTRAGRERYEQIVRAFKKLWGTEPVQRAAELSKEFLGNGMTTASERIRSAVEGSP